MADTNDKSIQYINLGDGEGARPIDAVSVGGKTAAEIGTLVTTLSGNEDDDTKYPSAKCVYTELGTIEDKLKTI